MIKPRECRILQSAGQRFKIQLRHGLRGWKDVAEPDSWGKEPRPLCVASTLEEAEKIASEVVMLEFERRLQNHWRVVKIVVGRSQQQGTSLAAIGVALVVLGVLAAVAVWHGCGGL